MSEDWKRKLTVFLASQTLSLFGSSLVQYAILWRITLDTKSGVMMTLATACGFVPTFLLSPLAGALADRHDRKRLIMLADGMIAAVTLAAALLFLSGHASVWLLLGVSAVRALGAAVHAPAVGALLPQIVPADKLMRANGVNGTIQSAVMLVSPMAAGALLSFTAIEVLFFVDVVTAALAIGVLFFLLEVPPHAKARGEQQVGYFADVRLGFRYIREHRYLVSFFAYVGILILLVTPAAFLTPLQVARTFGDQVWRLTAIEVVFSIGMTAGGAIVAAWGGFENRMRTIVAAGLLMAACTVGLAVVPWFWAYLAVMGVFGVGLPLYSVPAMTIVQEHVEPDYMGRVLSVLTMLSTSLMPLAMLVFGPIADAMRIEWMLLASGGAMLLHNLLVLRDRRLMEAGVPVTGPSAPGGVGPNAAAPAPAGD